MSKPTNLNSKYKLKNTLTTLSAGALVLAALDEVHAQYTPPPPPAPFQGFINEFFRAKDPYMNQWDFGGEIRVRFEAKEHIGVQGRASSADFRDHGVDNDNEYLLTRIRFHVGYTEKWWSVLWRGPKQPGHERRTRGLRQRARRRRHREDAGQRAGVGHD